MGRNLNPEQSIARFDDIGKVKQSHSGRWNWNAGQLPDASDVLKSQHAAVTHPRPERETVRGRLNALFGSRTRCEAVEGHLHPGQTRREHVFSRQTL